MVKQIGGLHDVHRLTFGKTLLDVDEYDFVSYVVSYKNISTSGAYVSCAYYGYLLT